MSPYKLIAIAGCAALLASQPSVSGANDGGSSRWACFGTANLSDYDPGLIRAMQSRLHERGLYEGPIDGQAGRATRAALGHLPGQSFRSKFQLDTELVQMIFGPNHDGIYYPEDQDRLMRQVGARPDPAYKNPCRRLKRVKVVSQ